MNHSLTEAPQTFSMVGVSTLHRESGSPTVLLFDSFCHPSSAGIRSATLGLRQMLYRADPYQIDLQLEADGKLNRLSVAGQLLDVSRPEAPGPSVQVTLSNLHGNTVNTATNHFGEFRGELENSGDLELAFLGPNGKRTVILLRGAVEQPSGT